MSNKREVISRTLERIKDISIDSILSTYMTIERKGGNYGGLCPFHDDQRLGNFHVNLRTNTFHCYACDTGGDSIEFVKKFLGIGFVETVILLGQDYGFISIDEYEKYFSGKGKPRKTKRTLKVVKKKESLPLVEKAESFILDVVYKELLRALPLSQEHRKHLNDERLVSDERIDVALYRSLGEENIAFVTEKVLSNLSKKGYDETVFEGIPGFYKKDGKWMFMSVKGILIPIKNYKQEIVGMQIRKDFCMEGDQRYVWFSSSFAYDKDKGFEHPCSPGNPIDIVYPSKQNRKDLFITEGRFEAEVLASKWGYTTLSVQGVGNWRGIEEEIIKMEYELDVKFEKIFIAFDSDVSIKYQVFEQLKKMSDSISEYFPSRKIVYLHWDGELGKGIGDLIIHNDNIKEENLIAQHDKQVIDQIYEDELNKLLKFKDLEKINQAKQIAIMEAFLI